jgi:hypothetical protein
MPYPPEKLERLKFQLNSQIEAQKWGYRKQELKFLEAGQHLRSLNQILWQIPSMVIAITGGLWYGVTTIDASMPKSVVLAFAAFVDVITIVVILRLRSVIGHQIDAQRKFADAPDDLSKKRDRTVVRCWAAMLLVAASLSMVGAFNVDSLAARKKEQVVVPQECRVVAEVNVAMEAASASTVAQKALSKVSHVARKRCP